MATVSPFPLLRGGVLLGQPGGFGCVFSPPLSVDGDGDGGGGGGGGAALAGKVQRADHAAAEWAIAQRFAAVDGDAGVYPRGPPLSLTGQEAAALRRSGAGDTAQLLTQCALFNNARPLHPPAFSTANLAELLMERGQTDVDNLPPLPAAGATYLSVAAALRTHLAAADHLLRGLAAFHAANLVHLDVKPGNVMQMSATPDAPRYRFIDFGLGQQLLLASEDSADAVAARFSIYRRPLYRYYPLIAFWSTKYMDLRGTEHAGRQATKWLLERQGFRSDGFYEPVPINAATTKLGTETIWLSQYLKDEAARINALWPALWPDQPAIFVLAKAADVFGAGVVLWRLLAQLLASQELVRFSSMPSWWTTHYRLVPGEGADLLRGLLDEVCSLIRDMLTFHVHAAGAHARLVDIVEDGRGMGDDGDVRVGDVGLGEGDDGDGGGGGGGGGGGDRSRSSVKAARRQARMARMFRSDDMSSSL